MSGLMCDINNIYTIERKTEARPAIICGLETVASEKSCKQELEVAETITILHFSMGVTRLDKIRKEHIIENARVDRLGDNVRESRLKWFCHVQMTDEEDFGKRMLKMILSSKRKKKKTDLREGILMETRTI